MGAQNFNVSPGFNDLSQCFGEPPPVNAPGLLDNINAACAALGDGAGAHAATQPPDVHLPPVGAMTDTAPRDTFNIDQYSETPGLTPANSLQSSIPTRVGPGLRMEGSRPIEDPDMIGGADVTNVPESIGTGRMGRA